MRKSFTLLKILLCVGLSCMSLFLAVGYAAISGTMVITGTAKYEPGTIYITKVIEGSEKFQKFGYLTLLGNHTFASRNETYTVKVEVKNNSGVDQYFDTVVIMDEAAKYTVPKVVTSTNATAQGVLLKNGMTETYTITFKSGASSVALSDAQNLLRFTPDYEDLTQIAATNISERFLQILNGDAGNITVEYTDSTIEYGNEEFLAELDAAMAQNDADTGNYIANVSGAKTDDQAIVDAIFGEFTSITLPNTEDPVPVKGLIKEQDVTGDGEVDMVLYVTADPLDEGGTYFNMNRVPVYAIVFERLDDEWVQKKDMLAGTAPVTDYEGNFNPLFSSEEKIGSFSTDYWRSTNNSTITNAYAAASEKS